MNAAKGIISFEEYFDYKALESVIQEDFDCAFTFHDFRTVVGVTHTNLIFDIVLPFEYKGSIDELVEKVSEAVLKRKDNCFCVITVDRG